MKITILVLMLISLSFGQHVRWIDMQGMDSVDSLTSRWRSNIEDSLLALRPYIYRNYYDFNSGDSLTNPGGVTVYPNMVYYKGTYNRTYISMLSLSSLPGASYTAAYIMYFDHDTKQFSSLTRLSKLQTGSDNHEMPAIWVTPSGYILAAYDVLQASGSNHNGGIAVMRSENPEDISSFTVIDTLREVGGGIAYGSYPCFIQIKDTVYCHFRWGLSSSDHHRRGIAKSTDWGLTWSAVDTIYDLGNSNYWAYTRAVIQTNYNYAGIISSWKDDGSGEYDDPHYIQTTDGITWTNASGSFSKNIVTEGTITKTELDNWCLIKKKVSGDANVRAPAGTIDKYGRAHITVQILDTPDDSVTVYYVYSADDTLKVMSMLPYVSKYNTLDDINNIYIYVPSDGYVEQLIQERYTPFTLTRFKTENLGISWETLDLFKEDDITPIVKTFIGIQQNINQQYMLFRIQYDGGSSSRDFRFYEMKKY